MVSAPAPLSATDAFALIMERLCQTVAAQSYRERMAAPLILLIWTRLRRLAARFAALAARVRAGTLRSRAPARRAASRPASPPASPSAASSAKRLRLARPARGVGGGRLRVAVAASLGRPGVRGAHRRRAADGAGLAPALPDAGRRCLRPAAAFPARGIAGARPRAGPDTGGPGTAGPDTSGHARRDAARWDAGAIARPGASGREKSACPPLGLFAGLGARRLGTT